MDNPATLDDARQYWPDAVALPDALLGDLLDAAWEGFALFLPEGATDPEPTVVPVSWRQGVVLHARDSWAAFRRDDSGVLGFDAYAVRVKPLSPAVARLARPPRGRPMVG